MLNLPEVKSVKATLPQSVNRPLLRKCGKLTEYSQGQQMF